MSFLFGGSRPSEADAIRAFQRQVTSAARGSEREITKLDASERALIRELKRCGAAGNVELATLKARELIRTRAHRSRLYKVRSNLSGLAQQLGQVHSSQRTIEFVARTARVLQSLNGRMDARAVHQMLMEFQRQNDSMGDKQEVLDDTLDSAFETDGEAAATDDAVTAVFQEAGVDEAMRLSRAGASTALPGAPDGDLDLEGRFNRLRRQAGDA